MLLVKRVQKLGAQMNVELMVGEEVFGRHEDRLALQPPLAGHNQSRLWLQRWIAPPG
jgi:hypothetical protein